MPTANDRQHGGDHYRKVEYQHWDWVCDTDQPYLLACASKYLIRWRDKGGKLDLEKATHYLDKAMERAIKIYVSEGAYARCNELFISQLPEIEGNAVALMMGGFLLEARIQVQKLIDSAE